MQWLSMYVAISAIIGLVGMNRKLGFWGYFFGSLLLSPPIGVILVFCSDKRPNLS